MDTSLTAKPDEIRQFVLAERDRCLSDREWRHRIAGYGYAISRRAGAEILTSLPHGREICRLG